MSSVNLQELSPPKETTSQNKPYLNSVYHIDATHSNKHARLLHTHQSEVELYFVSYGEGTYTVDSRTYNIKPGDMVICNAGVLHGDNFFQNRSVNSYCCAYKNVLFEDLPPNHLLAPGIDAVISLKQNDIANIDSLMKIIYDFSQEGEPMYETCNHLALSVLSYIKLQLKQILQKKSKHQNRRSKEILAEQIKKYLQLHFTESITLKSLGDEFHLNPYYISHVFKTATNYSPIQYVMNLRLGEAQTLLMDTYMPISEISDKLGYGDPCHFNAMFTKYIGISPGKYRRSFLDDNEN